MKNKKIDIVVWGITAITVLITLAIYPSLPEKIVIHWSYNGTASEPGNKANLLWLLILMGGSNILFVIMSKIDPKRDNYEKFSKVYHIFRVLFSLFMASMVATVLIYHYKSDTFNVNKVIYMLMGILFAVIGNYLPKCKHNYSFGIKTPWALASEEVWDKTHRMAGPIWMAGGVIISLTAIILPTMVSSIGFVVLMFVSMVPMVYSYFAYQKNKKNETEQ